jgi:hypothetical protein
MSFYTCDNCDEHKDYGNSTKATYEIEQLDLRFCSYDCLLGFFKKLNDKVIEQ